MQDIPVVRLNRAVAVAERDGRAAGLALVDAIGDLAAYPWWHATRAELLNRIGQTEAARRLRAGARARNERAATGAPALSRR